MKKRIFSIMDMKNKKAGLVVLCGVLMLTLGTGFAMAANTQAQDPPESLKEDIMVSTSFLPDPAIYSKYASYGITISDDGNMLLYNGQQVRLFVDEGSDVEAFFLDERGGLDLTVIRNATGNITGIESISQQKAEEYRSSFFANDLNAVNTSKDIPQDIAKDIATDMVGQSKYEQYSAYGIVVSSDGKGLHYNGHRVKLLADILSDGSFETYWFDETGTVNLSVIRNSSGQITAIESVSDEKAQEYISAAKEYEQNTLNGLDEKIAARMKELYPEN